MKNAITILFSTFVLLFVSMTTGLATTIYLNSSAGNDATGNGTSGSPYKTFTKGYALSNPSDILDLTGTFTWTDVDELGDAITSGFTIAKNISIQGHAGQTIIQAGASSGVGNCRVFTVDAAFSVTFNNLEIRYGNPAYPGDGGAMYFGSSATITISNCYIHHNISRQGAGICIMTASVNITNSTISNNNGTTLQTGLNGGGICLQGSLPLTITNTTICNNYIYGYGGGINTLTSNATIITNCAIVNNTSELDGGGISMGGPAGCAVQIKNTMVANNTSTTVPAAADFDMFQGTLTDNGYNIVEVGTGTFSAPTDITGNQANLFGTGIGTTPVLALNGSVNGTPTLALGAGSIAIDKGSSAANGSVAIPTTDQRGLGRSGLTDIGSYEYGAVASNNAPTDISLLGSSVNENVATNTTVGTLSTTDPDVGNSFTYTLVAGTGSTDNASFNISGSSLRITNSPDFEIKNSYSVRIRTTDQGSLYYEKAFTITIMDVNETPTDINLSASSVNENVIANTTVGTLSSTDQDVGNSFTYTLVAGTGSTDNASFNISGSSLRITNSPDFETKSSYSVRIRTSDQGSLFYEKAFTIAIMDVNETPTDINLSASSVNENVIANTTVGTLSSTDQDVGNSFTYTLVAGTGSIDNASFNISGSSLRITNSPDFEIKNSYSVRIRTTDQGSLYYEKAFTITIMDVNETPTDINLSASSVNENVIANTTVGTLSSTDQDVGNSFTYTLVAGTGSTDNASFNISGSSLRITNSPDFETKSSYSVRIRTSDQGSLFYEKAFTIAIMDVNETPTDINLSASSVNENVIANTTVGTLSSTDQDVGNSFTYTLVAGTGSIDNASFNISGSSLRITNSPDFEIKNSYSVRIRTTDQGSLYYEKAFTITIMDVNETPTDINLSASSVNENVIANTTVGTLSSTDQDVGNSFTYTLVAGTGSTDNASFNISGSSLRITNSPDFETKSSYSVRIRTSDQGSLFYEKAFTIAIMDVNETPTDINLSASSVNENVIANTTVGTLSSTDQDVGNSFTYTLVAGTGSTDNASFNISGSSLRITNSPDFEIKNSYSVRIRTTDQGSLFYEKTFTITIMDVNETPTDINLSASSVNENVIANTTVGTLSSTDQDVGNSFTYTLVAGTGSTDNASFNISGSSLRITNSPDFEIKNSYSVRIRTTDQGSLYYEKAFTITIMDVNETPTDINLSASSVNENVIANTTVGTLSSTDQDVGNSFTYTLVAGTGSTDNASFNISGSSLRITNSPDFEIKNSYSVRIRTTDQGTLFFEKAFTITIVDVNETPTDINLSASSVNENVIANTTVGTLSSTDQDVGNSFTYTLVPGTGSTDNASFNISGSSLRITNSPDFEIKNSYSVRIRTTDQGSLYYEKAFTITIMDVNETPTDINLSASSVNENVIANTTVGTLSSTDQDVGNSFTYTLVAGTGSTDNASFNISGSSLRITNSPDFETKSSYSVRIRTTDQGSLFYEKAFIITIIDLDEYAVVTTQAVNNISTNTATGNGTITDLGSPNPTAYGVCWNTTGTPTTSDSKVDNGVAIATGAFTASMTGLTANTTYYVRAYATNTSGTSYGTEESFTTMAPTIAFNSTSSSGAESISSANLQVDLSTASGLTVTVDYTVTGTATGGGTDYTLANGTLTISSGNISNNIIIDSIVDDLLDEGDETIIVTLSNPVNATLGTNTVHTYTIVDNDNTTNVSDLTHRSISVYPNPFTYSIHLISWDASHIIISDLLGQIVLKADCQGEKDINVGHLTPGVYLLTHLNDKGEKQMIKLIKE